LDREGASAAFGRVLRSRRVVAELTQEELAQKAGVSVRAISDMETGRTCQPRMSSVRLLAGAMGLSGIEREYLIQVASGAGGRLNAGLAAGAAVPRQLPAVAAGFTGRVAELAVLDGLLDQAAGCGGPVVISAIGGTAGVGKTALATYWAHRVAGRFPDGQLYVNLRGFGPSGTPVSPAAAVRLFLDGLGIEPERIPAGLDAQAALYRSVLAGRRMLIVADNARDPEQVRPLLPGTPGCLVVVTSRNQFAGLAAAEGAHLISLDVLTEPEALELLSRRLGRRAAAEPGAVAELARLCAGLPLALSIAAARAAAQPALPLTALAGGLREAGSRLDALSTGEMATDVRTVLSWSCQQLSSQADRVFRLLGLHPGPDISLPAAASLAGLPADGTRRAMAELVRAHLVTEHVPGRFACHDLLRAYAAEQFGSLPEAQRHSAAGRMLDHYLHAAVGASRLIYAHPEPIPLRPPRAGTRPEGFADRQEAVEWFRAECQVLLAVIGQAAADAEFSRYAWQLPWAVALFLDGAGCWQELAMVQESALAAASGDGNRAAQAAAHFHLSTAQMRVGAFAEATAHLAAMLELGQELGDDLLQAQAHGLLSRIFERQGRTHDALGSAEHALRLYRAAGDRAREACALNSVGWQYARLGRYQETLSLCGRALTMHREQGTRVGEAGALDSLGYAHHHLGDHGQAIVRFQQAIEILDDDADIHFRSEILTHLGDASHAAGNPAAARQAWEEALAILDDLQHADAEQVRSRLAAPQFRASRNPGVRD
jgi:tetratricopeptide (TPR) repeat protein/transcriptional regulator with XRE-family HTH domain